MARALTAGMQSAVVADHITPVLLIRGIFDSGSLNLWSGIGLLTVDSIIYTGAGDLISLSAVRETTNLEAVGVTFTLSSAPEELLAIAHNEDYQDRPLYMYLALLDEDYHVINAPYMLFEGRMDTMVLDDMAEQATIEMAVENVLIDLTKPIILNYTAEDQELLYPGDTGFKFMTSLQEKELLLGGG